MLLCPTSSANCLRRFLLHPKVGMRMSVHVFLGLLIAKTLDTACSDRHCSRRLPLHVNRFSRIDQAGSIIHKVRISRQAAPVQGKSADQQAAASSGSCTPGPEMSSSFTLFAVVLLATECERVARIAPPTPSSGCWLVLFIRADNDPGLAEAASSSPSHPNLPVHSRT